MSKPGSRLRGRALPSVAAYLLPALLLLASLPMTPTPGEAGKIEILESDTLRTSESKRSRTKDDSGFRITITTDEEDTLESRVRFGNSRWIHVEDSGEGVVRFGEDITIGIDEVIDGSVVALGGNIVVRGRVTEDVVALGGSLTLESGSVVEGDAVAIGGTLKREEGARLEGENVGLRFIPRGFGSFGGPGDNAVLLVCLAVWVVFLWISGLVFEWVVPLRMRNVAEQVRIRLWPSFFAGLAVHVLFWPLVVLLTVTVIGIPLAVLLPFLAALVTNVGTVVVIALLGARLWGNAALTTRSDWFRGLTLGLAVVAGFSLVAAVLSGLDSLIGTVGGLFLMSVFAAIWTLATIGIGAVALSRFGGRAPAQLPPVPGSGGTSIPDSDPDPFAPAPSESATQSY